MASENENKKLPESIDIILNSNLILYTSGEDAPEEIEVEILRMPSKLEVHCIGPSSWKGILRYIGLAPKGVLEYGIEECQSKYKVIRDSIKTDTDSGETSLRIGGYHFSIHPTRKSFNKRRKYLSWRGHGKVKMEDYTKILENLSTKQEAPSQPQLS